MTKSNKIEKNEVIAGLECDISVVQKQKPTGNGPNKPDQKV